MAIVAMITVWSLNRQFGAISIASLSAAIREQPASRLFAALGLTALSFLCLALYDVAGARIVAAQRVPTRTALFAGAMGNAVSNTLGFHAVTGMLVRAPIYRRLGLTRTEVARVVSLAWVALGMGFITMFAAAELMQSLAGEYDAAALAVGGSISAGLSIFLIWLATGTRRLSVFGFKQSLPSARLALLQMAIGGVESAAAIGALYVLLPTDIAPSFSVFAVGCIAAVTLGVLAHSPGGVGIFEASITAMLAGAGRADLLAALLMYRAVYNLLPFVLSIAALALMWLIRRDHDHINSTAGIG